MLDPDEVAAYEAWKEHRITSSPDLSIAAYNMEMGASAAAWEDGARAAIAELAGSDVEKRHSLTDLVLSKNPHRAAGMRGHIAR